MPLANADLSRAQQSAVMAELESTYGTDPTPVAATDDVLVYDNPVISEVEVEKFAFQPFNNSFTKQTDVIGARHYRIRLKTLLQTSGTDGTIAVNGFKGLDALLSACRMTSTANVGDDVTYAPSTIAALESCTIWAKQGKFIKKALGCVGNVTMTMTPRSATELMFDMLGLYSAPVAVSTTFDAYTGGTKRAQACLGIGCSITGNGAYSPIISKLVFNCGVEFVKVESMNDSTGVDRLVIVDANPTLTLTFKAENYASAGITYDEWFTDLFSSGPTTHAVLATISTTTNKIAFSWPTAQLVGITEPVDGKLIDIEATYKIQHTTLQSEWSMIMGTNAV